MTNVYYDTIKNFQEKLTEYTKQILKVYGYELKLMLEDYNLLANENNCLESSTAFGYIIEEFLVSKLETYTKLHNLPGDYVVKRNGGSTNTSSYDCFSMLINEIKAMVNIKAEKNANHAVAAINKLYRDYVVDDPDLRKCYLVFKIHYYIDMSTNGQRKIFIDENNIESYFLEEVDFSQGHKQDNRQWTENGSNRNSGRLEVTPKFRSEHSVEKEKISYDNTNNQIANIFNRNKI